MIVVIAERVVKDFVDNDGTVDFEEIGRSGSRFGESHHPAAGIGEAPQGLCRSLGRNFGEARYSEGFEDLASAGKRQRNELFGFGSWPAAT